jgi:hypothetical protein
MHRRSFLQEASMTASFLTGHMALAGLIGATTGLAEVIAGPALAPFVEISGAALTAAVAAHAVHRIVRTGPLARDRTYRVLSRVAPRASHRHGGILAAKALDLACSVGAPASKSARVGGTILRQMLRRQIVGALGKVLTCWCPPLAGGARVFAISRSVLDSALFMRTVECAATELLAAA